MPYGDGALLPELHAAAGDLQREETADGVRVVARVPAALVSRYERYAVNGRNGDR